MGRIAINDMRFYAHHGCFDQARVIGTHFRVDLWFDVDTSAAEVSDSIGDTVNYLEVYQAVAQEMGQSSHLLEHIARRVGNRLLVQFPGIKSVGVKVYKLNPPLGGQMQSVSVELTLTR